MTESPNAPGRIFFGSSGAPSGEIRKPPGQQRPFEALTESEKRRFAEDAAAEAKKFVDWSETTLENNRQKIKGSWIGEQWKHAPSKKLFLTTLGTVGLANVGLTAAAVKANMTPLDIWTIWDSTMGTIMLEELAFRSRKIPDIIQWAGKSMGFRTRPDTARRLTDAFFAGIHFHQLDAFPQLFIMGSAASKTAHEKGLLASSALHSINNALYMSHAFLFEGSLIKSLLGAPTKGLLPESKYTKPLKTMYTLARIGLQVGLGIAGIKEMIEDKKVNDMLAGARASEYFTDQAAVTKVTRDLLSHPSTDGYKFQAGTELAYLTARMSVSDLPDTEDIADNYARQKVKQLVSETWKDPATLDYRLHKAFAHIDSRLSAARTIDK